VHGLAYTSAAIIYEPGVGRGAEDPALFNPNGSGRSTVVCTSCRSWPATCASRSSRRLRGKRKAH